MQLDPQQKKKDIKGSLTNQIQLNIAGATLRKKNTNEGVGLKKKTVKSMTEVDNTAVTSFREN